MTTKEIIVVLINTDDYAKERNLISDGVIKLFKEHMPFYYDLIKDKEAKYQSEIQKIG